MNVNATFIGVDDWSRCLIKTDGGTTLCDTECLDPEVIKADPNKGDWHAINDWGEPVSRIKSTVNFTLNPEP